MPRVNRKYERKDFSKLLAELNPTVAEEEPAPVVEKPVPAPKAPSTPPVVSQYRRRRSSLMDRPAMRYAFSIKKGIAHDRDCSYVSDIRDEDFDMRSCYPEEGISCPECQKIALLRSAISDNEQSKVGICHHLLSEQLATMTDLKQLILTEKAKISDISPESIKVHVGEDSWKILFTSKGLRLMHNNYYVTDRLSRVFTKEFHIQNDSGIHTIHHYIAIMTGYSWKAHIEMFLRREEAQYQYTLRTELAETQNTRRLRRFAFLSSWYVFVDCGNHARKLLRKKKLSPQMVNLLHFGESPYALKACRIWWWQKGHFMEIMEELKEYSVTSERYEYIDYCRELVS